MNLKLNKKASSAIGMGLVFTVMFVAIAAGIVYGTDGLNSTDFTGNAPSWLQTLLPLAVGFALIGIVTRKK